MNDRVKEWLVHLGLEQYAGAFAENEVGWELLSQLDHQTLVAMGVSLAGHRLRILRAAKALDPDPSGLPSTDEESEEIRQQDSLPNSVLNQAERRQLTVMFCDLVGSTNLSARRDLSDVRDVVRAYQVEVARVIRQFDGHIAQYLGDGLLVYFGYPEAHVGEAQRAVYAGLGIPAAIAELNTRLQSEYGISIQVRVGVHTGPVVVGEMGDGADVDSHAVGS